MPLLVPPSSPPCLLSTHCPAGPHHAWLLAYAHLMCLQAAVRAEPLDITYSYYNGTGHRRKVTVRKGDTIGQFLKAVQEQLVTQFREMRCGEVRCSEGRRGGAREPVGCVAVPCRATAAGSLVTAANQVLDANFIPGTRWRHCRLCCSQLAGVYQLHSVHPAPE